MCVKRGERWMVRGCGWLLSGGMDLEGLGEGSE